MELIIHELAVHLERFAEHLQDVGGELFRDAFRTHQIRELTVQQLRYLEVVEANPGLTPGDLAAAFQVKKPTVSNIVRQLERDGLIHRENDAIDRRVYRIHPTEVSIDIFRKRREMYTNLAEHIGTRLTHDELVDLERLLRKASTETGENHG
tara:strand:- start:1490 stop:1945 length:456 start_codon:yes stop_codon:yes gene_type:complete